MKHLSAVIQQAIPGAVAAAPLWAELPDPARLAPDDATALGSRILQEGGYVHAFPYLLRGVRGKPSAFGWCRLGKLCRDADRPEHAIRCYVEALLLEPGNRYALVGYAAALAECPDATLAELVEAYLDLMSLLRSDASPGPVLWTAHSVVRALIRLRPEPMLYGLVGDLERAARAANTKTSAQSDRELERRLEGALWLQQLVPSTPRDQLTAARRAGFTTGPGDSLRLLGP